MFPTAFGVETADTGFVKPAIAIPAVAKLSVEVSHWYAIPDKLVYEYAVLVKVVVFAFPQDDGIELATIPPVGIPEHGGVTSKL